jgi:hypothetical protein
LHYFCSIICSCLSLSLFHYFCSCLSIFLS